MATVRLQGIEKTFPNGVRAVHPTTLAVADGEFVVLVGPSGCGKSTLLRMIAGLETPTAGKLFIGERDVTEVAPRDRDCAMVFQSYALYPHMTVYKNMAFGLSVRGTPKAEIDRRVRAAAGTLGLAPLLGRKPRELSGGQMQRVALGRALVREPAVFLLDEPLSNLDAKLRGEVRVELSRLHRTLRATMVYVTHDQVEAMTLADRVVVLSGGVVQQVGTPIEVYEKPANRFVAGFFGSPPMNFIRARVEGGTARAGGVAIARDDAVLPPLEGRDVDLGVRPEDLCLSAGEGGIAAGVEVVEPLGDHTLAYFESEGRTLVGRFPPHAFPARGDRVRVAPRPGRFHVFDAESGRAIR